MRQIFYVILLALIPLAGIRAQGVSPVKIGEECKQQASWYRAQASAWGQVTERQPSNADAWLNLFQATRFSMIAAGQQAAGPALDSILSHMGRHSRTSFEYHYASFLHDRNTPDAYSHLQAAQAAAPGRVELFDDLMWWYESQGNSQGKADAAGKWLRNGGLSPEVGELCSNILLGTGNGAVLITAGYADTYSLWLYQQQSGKKAQHITSLEMLKEPVYRERFLSRAGLRNPYPGNRINDEHALLLQLLSLNQGREIHLSLNHGTELLTSLSDKLFLAGLSFRMSTGGNPSADIVPANWSKYSLTQFDRICRSAPAGSAHPLMAGYLMPLMVMHRNLSGQGRQREAEGYLEQAEAIARATGRSATLEKVMERRE